MLGGLLGWRFVRSPLLRIVHLVLIFVVAPEVAGAQALLTLTDLFRGFGLLEDFVRRLRV